MARCDSSQIPRVCGGAGSPAGLIVQFEDLTSCDLELMERETPPAFWAGASLALPEFQGDSCDNLIRIAGL